VLVEFFADGSDAAVHHVGRGDDVGTGAGVGEGLVGEDGDGGVVGYGGFVGEMVVLDYAAVAVVGVFAKADIGDY